MFKRQIIDLLKDKIEKVSVLFLLGPGQSGKTTLVKQLFPDFTYISFENPEYRLQAATNLKKFLRTLPETLILDDVHLVPGMFRFLAVYAHSYFKTKKWIVLSPVNGFMKKEKPVPLSGYVSFLVLLPLGYHELGSGPEKYEEALFTGGFPAAVSHTASLSVFFSSYLNTFLQKDLWLLKRVRNIPQFLQFMKNCAVRAGQTLDYSGLARETGISINAAKQWVQLLEDAFIIFMLPPFHHDFGKRRVRTPKMYFYDTGLLSYLLGIQSPDELTRHPAKKIIFENFFLLEQMKFRLNHGLPLNSFFWRDNRKNELKCVIDGQPPHIIEFCANKTFTKDILKQVKLWNWLSGYDKETCHVVYGGNQSFQFLTSIYSWRDLNQLFSVLENH